MLNNFPTKTFQFMIVLFKKLPPHPFTQGHDVCHMMTPMPGIHAKQMPKRQLPFVLGMKDGSLPILCRKVF